MSMRHRWILLAALAVLPACDSCSSKSSAPTPHEPAANATTSAGTTPASPARTGSPTAHPVSTAEEREWSESVELAETFAELMKKNVGDCDELATAIEQWTGDHTEALDRERTRVKRISAGARETLTTRDKERLEKVDEIIDKTLASCQDHPRVKKAMEALPSDE